MRFVGGKDSHAVYCLDAPTGKQRWQFTAGGPVDSPPTIAGGVNRQGSPRFGVDGDLNTSALAANEWPWTFEVDLLEVRAVRRVKVTFAKRGFATDLRLQVSADKKTWQSIANAADLDGSPYATEFVPVKAQWIRVSALKPNGPNQKGMQMAVAELEVYE